MSIYQLQNGGLSELNKVSFKEINYMEQDLQDLIKRSPNILGEDLLIISEEYTDWYESKKKVDLLALDKKGNIVVIELKRDNDGFHMDLQAIRYASMLSIMTYENAVSTFEKYLVKQEEDPSHAQNTISDFLEDAEDVNFGSNVRIILVNNAFSKELTTSVLWLNKKGLDIKCVLVLPYINNNQEVYIDVDVLIPLKETNDYTIALEKKEQEKELVRKLVNSKRDNTKYVFEGIEYGKGRLACEVVMKYVSEHSKITFEELESVFPRSFQGSHGVIKYKKDVVDTKRFFMDDVIILSDKEEVVVCSQWGIGNICHILNKARELGYVITEK